MRRWGDGDRFLRRMADIRRREPEAAFRSNFIVGYPGETEADHDQLLAFIDAAQLDWCGFFAYSRAPTAAAAASTLIDFAMRQIPAQDIRAAGHSGVINYVSTSRPGSSFGAKPITLPYAQALTAAGLMIVSNYQYGKPGGTAPSDFTRG